MRYAIYYTPYPDELLARLGSTWLGRDAETGAILEQPSALGLTPKDIARLTAEPRRYGFHATLMPPFTPAKGITELAVRETIQELARCLKAVRLLPLQVVPLSGFLALVQSNGAGAVGELADRCVSAFHPLRAPPDEDELVRRRKTNLSPRQAALLETWGYPYVFDEFRFHLSLTGPLNEAEQSALLPALRPGRSPR